MKKHILASAALSAVLVFIALFSGCSLLNKTPKNFTEGIDYSKDYEDDVLEIYDDATVFDELNAFGEAVLFCGSEDDFEDIVDFYKEFFEDNEITLSEEAQERDEYYAKGVFDGYEFKLQIKEAEGEYVEELFENIITLSTRELSDEDMAAAAATPTPAPDESQPPEATQALQSDVPSERPDNDKYETKLETLDVGSWMYESYLTPDDTGGSIDWTIYINGDGTGRMYYSDYVGNEHWFEDIAYDIEDGVLSFEFANGDIWNFFAYLDYGTLHLIPAYDFSNEYYLTNYGEESFGTSFEAYGAWMVYYPSDGFLGTIAFWPDGTGYVYNWYDEEKNYYFEWENNDGVVTFYDEEGDFDSFTFRQRHNVLEYTSTDDGSTYFYNRTELNLLIGSYEMINTNYPEETS